MNLSSTNIAKDLQQYVCGILQKDQLLSAMHANNVLYEDALDIEFQVREALGKQGMVNIVSTPKMSYQGTWSGVYQAYTIDELQIQSIENPVIRRAQLKKDNLSVGTALDVALRTSEILAGPLGGHYGEFTTKNIEQGEADGLVVVKATFGTTVYHDLSSVISSSTDGRYVEIPFAGKGDLVNLSAELKNDIKDLSGSLSSYAKTSELSSKRGLTDLSTYSKQLLDTWTCTPDISPYYVKWISSYGTEGWVIYDDIQGMVSYSPKGDSNSTTLTWSGGEWSEGIDVIAHRDEGQLVPDGGIIAKKSDLSSILVGQTLDSSDLTLKNIGNYMKTLWTKLGGTVVAFVLALNCFATNSPTLETEFGDVGPSVPLKNILVLDAQAKTNIAEDVSLYSFRTSGFQGNSVTFMQMPSSLTISAPTQIKDGKATDFIVYLETDGEGKTIAFDFPNLYFSDASATNTSIGKADSIYAYYFTQIQTNKWMIARQVLQK